MGVHPDARRLIQESQSYAVMNRQAVLGFRSAYSLKLYEEGALRLHRRQPVWKVDMVGLRAALGIEPEKYKDFAQLRRKVLTVAKAKSTSLPTSRSNGTKSAKAVRWWRLSSDLRQRMHQRSFRLSMS
jgi:plasmid replication initiation protein